MSATREWSTFGATTVVLKVTAPAALGRAEIAARSELEAIDRACSRFRADSELSLANARAGRVGEVGTLLGEALALAMRAAALTDGSVDPTVGRAVELAGYDRDWEQVGDSRLPGARVTLPAIRARRLSGWRHVTFDQETGLLRVPRGIKLDLGATAKAWAADRACAAASAAGGCGALVAVGGDVATAGEPPADGWLLRVTDDHRDSDAVAGQLIRVRSGGLATSSTTTRRWLRGRRQMHHIIDPRTGVPARSCWRTVSVAAGSCADANIAATAALIAGERGPGWLAELELPARLVANDGTVLALAGWPEPEPMHAAQDVAA